MSKNAGFTIWGRLIKAWITNEGADNTSAAELAERLYKSIDAGEAADEFLQLLPRVDHATYLEVVRIFQEKHSESIRDVIHVEFASQGQYSFLIAHDYLVDPVQAVASIMNSAVGKFNHEQLAYAVALFGDSVKAQISKVYARMEYGDLQAEIEHNFDGAFRMAIVTILFDEDAAKLIKRDKLAKSRERQ